MISIVYLAIFVASLALVLSDKDFETVQKPCTICMPRYLIILSLVSLFVGAEAFSLLATHRAWVISGVMSLSMSGFIFGVFCAWERKKSVLASLQIIYAAVIAIHFYAWW
jgi:hypothetical protein